MFPARNVPTTPCPNYSTSQLLQCPIHFKRAASHRSQDMRQKYIEQSGGCTVVVAEARQLQLAGSGTSACAGMGNFRHS